MTSWLLQAQSALYPYRMFLPFVSLLLANPTTTIPNGIQSEFRHIYYENYLDPVLRNKINHSKLR